MSSISDIGKSFGDPEGEYIISENPKTLEYVWSGDGQVKFKETSKAPTKDFISDQPKMLVGLSLSFFSVIVEDFASIMYFSESVPNLKVLLVPPPSGSKKVLDYIVQTLDRRNVDYEVLSSLDVLNIDNYFYLGIYILNESTSRALTKAFRESVESPRDPNRRVYLSRKIASPIQSNFLPISSKKSLEKYSLDDLRIDDERKLEDYFSSKGFEILYAEDFETLQDHVDYMNSVKVLVSVFSSGLASLFMLQPNQLVIEFPVVGTEFQDAPRRVLYCPYQPLAYHAGINYLSVADTFEDIETYRWVESVPEVLKALNGSHFYPLSTKRKADQIILAFESLPYLNKTLD